MPKGIVFDLRRHALHDGPGIRTVVFLKGCPLSCAWCHNPEGLSFEPETARRPERCLSCGECRKDPVAGPCPAGAIETVGAPWEASDVAKAACRDEAYYRQSRGGVTFSGGEPLAQPDFILASLAECGKLGMHTAVDTSGFAESGLMREAARLTDLFIYDLKLMDPVAHRKWTGVSNESILSNLEELARSGADCLLSVPVVPGVNDDAVNAVETARFVSGLEPSWPVRLLPYHAAARSKYARRDLRYALPDAAPPTEAVLASIAGIFRENGINVSIGGLS